MWYKRIPHPRSLSREAVTMRVPFELKLAEITEPWWRIGSVNAGKCAFLEDDGEHEDEDEIAYGEVPPLAQ
jgi:hypothetical protein